MNNKDDSSKTSLEKLISQDTTRGGQQRRDPSFSHFVDPHDDEYEESDRDTDFDAGYQTDSVEEDEEFDDALAGDHNHEQDEDHLAAAESDTHFDLESAEDEEEEEEPDDWLEQEDASETGAPEGRHWPVGLIAVAIVALMLLAAGGYGVMQQRAATEAELRQLRASLATSASPEEVRSSRGALQELQRDYDKLTADAEALKLENHRLADTVAGLETQLGAQQSALGKTSAITEKPATAASGKSTVAAPAVEPVAAKSVTAQSPSSTATPVQSSVATPATVAPRADAPRAKPAPVMVGLPTEVRLAEAPPAMASPTKPAAAKAAPVVAPHVAAASTAASTASGQWFVNFGSYATHTMAESWAAKLHPDAGKVIIAPVNNSAGKTLYRLRIVGLADRDTAKAVAHKLEAEQRVSELWVGKE